MEDKKKLTGAAAIVMSSIIVSRITGYLRELLVPNMIASKEVSDAYVMSFRVTGLMYDLLVGGAIAAALIPILTSYITKKDEENGWKAVGTFINLVILSMCVVCFLGIIFAPQIVPVIAKEVKSEYQRQLVIDLTRILFPSVAFLMLAGLSIGVLNAYQRFAAAAYGPTIYNLGSTLSILLFSNSKWGVKGIAFGVMISALIYFLFQFISAFRHLKFYRFAFYFKHEGFRKLFRLAIPSLLASAIVQINLIITARFTTWFEAGSVTLLSMADRTWQMPYGIFAQGMGIAMLPTLAEYFAKGEIKEYKDTLIKGINTVLFFTIPSGIGFIVLNEQIIRTIFKLTSNLTEDALQSVGRMLMFFSIALLSQSIVTIVNRAYYAINNTTTPLLVGVCTIITNYILCNLFYTNIGIGGMALAYSLSSVLNALLLLLLLNKKMNGIHLNKLMFFLSKVIPASLIMGCVLVLLNNLIPPNQNLKIVQVLSLFFKIGVGVVVYYFSVLLFKVEEAKQAKDTFYKKFGGILKKLPFKKF